jgi:hypothetical protein
MGNEATCRVEIGKQSAEAKALIETDELIVRGALKARIPFAEIKELRGDDGVLSFRWKDLDVRIHAGREAAKWAEKIRNPKSVLDKLGVRSGQKVSVIGAVEPDFVDQLAAKGADVSRRLRNESDLIFLAADARSDLDRLTELRRALTAAGAVWVLRPKGRSEITERDVMDYAKRAGLVDVKVVRFSVTHTAEKLVIPVGNRS